MNEELPDELRRALDRMASHRAPPELRAVVLSAAAEELGRADAARVAIRRARLQSRLARSVAAAVLLSLGMNVAVGMLEARRTARMYRPAPIRSDVAEITAAIAAVTDATVARRIEPHLSERMRRQSQAVSPLLLEMQEIKRLADGA